MSGMKGSDLHNTTNISYRELQWQILPVPFGHKLDHHVLSPMNGIAHVQYKLCLIDSLQMI